MLNFSTNEDVNTAIMSSTTETLIGDITVSRNCDQLITSWLHESVLAFTLSCDALYRSVLGKVFPWSSSQVTAPSEKILEILTEAFSTLLSYGLKFHKGRGSPNASLGESFYGVELLDTLYQEKAIKGNLRPLKLLVLILLTAIFRLVRAIYESSKEPVTGLMMRAVPVLKHLEAWNSAFYLITGKYPTLAHRLSTLQHVRRLRTDATANDNCTLIARVAKVIGIFLAVDLSLQALKTALRFWKIKSPKLVPLEAMYNSSTRGENLRCPEGELQRHPFSGTTGLNVSTAKHLSNFPKECPVCDIRFAPAGRSDRHIATCAPCGHIFCWMCATQWVIIHNSCPLCRSYCVLADILPLQHFAFTADYWQQTRGGH